MTAKDKAQGLITGETRIDWVHPEMLDTVLDELCVLLGFTQPEKFCSFRFTMDMEF